MQVVILCGGQGTRIRDVAEDIPKPMVPLGDQPILWHIMKRYAHYGHRDFILCLGYKSWTIKSYFLDFHLAQADLRIRLGRRDELEVVGAEPEDDWRVTLAETGLHAMTGCRVKRIAKYITGEHFMLTYGDGVADVDIRKLLAFHRRYGKIGTVTAVCPPARFGELRLAGSKVAEFKEKPLLSGGRINGGYFVFHRSFLDRLEDDPELVLEREPLARLARDGQLMAYRHDSFWYPMDNSRDYNYLNSLWLSGQAPWRTESRRTLRRAA